MAHDYQFNEDLHLHIRPGSSESLYSSYEEVDERIWNIVTSVQDRSTFSREVMAAITDWPSRYHLSAERTNLLRPFETLLHANVLEVGSGCGVLTRFLGEQSTSVVAVERNVRRAQIAAARCKGLPNVRIYCDNFQNFSLNERFHIVTCIDAIEHSPMSFHDENPFGEMLRLLGSHVTRDGYVLIGIENRLGLKSFAGAPDGHTGVRFQSLEGLYGPATPRTFGRREWEYLLKSVGLEVVSFWYPFPDHKLPKLMLSSAAFRQEWLNLSSLIRGFPAPDRGTSYDRLFSEEMVWPVLVKNGLAEDLANAFLIVARRTDARQSAWVSFALAHHYATGRLPEYTTEMSIEGQTEVASVCRRRLYPFDTHVLPYRHRILNEPYLREDLYSDQIYSILNTTNWELEDVAQWARPWLEYLRTRTYDTSNGSGLLPRDFIDYVPFNLVRRKDGTFHAFDLEYIAESPLSLEFVLFRGILGTLARVGTCAAPLNVNDLRLTEVTFAVMRLLGVDIDSRHRRRLITEEAKLQSAVLGLSLDHAIRAITVRLLSIRRLSQSPHNLPFVECQLFWTQGKQPDFDELNSARFHHQPTPMRRMARFFIPAGLTPEAQLRLDLANQTGIAQLFSIRLLDFHDDLIWEWNGNVETLIAFPRYNMDILVGASATGVFAYFLTDDPRLILPIEPDVLRALALAGGTLEVDFTWLGAIQYDRS